MTIEDSIGYYFKNKTYLEEALTHTSYANEHNVKSNEKLEYLGDSILEFVSSEFLYNNFTELIYNITDPMLKPFKDVLDKYLNLPIDFSPLLFIITIEAVEKILIRLIIVIF